MNEGGWGCPLPAASEGCTGHWLGLQFGLAAPKEPWRAWPWVGTATTPSSTPTLQSSRYCPGQFKFYKYSICTYILLLKCLFLYWTYPNFFASLSWLALTLLAKIHVNLYAFQKKVESASTKLFFYLNCKQKMLHFIRHLNCFDCMASPSKLITHILIHFGACCFVQDLRSKENQGWRGSWDVREQPQQSKIVTMASKIYK